MNMKAVPFLIGFSLMSVVLLTSPLSVNAQAGPCACKDKADLINQLNKSSAALNAIQQYLKTTKPTDMTNEIPATPANNKLTWKEIINGAIYQAGLDVDDANAQAMIIKTDSSSCGVTTAGTQCLKSIADKSSILHEVACLFEKNPKSGGVVDVPNYLRKVSDAYRAEVAEILNRLKALQKTCKLDDWIGTIQYSFVSRAFNKNEKPGVVETIEDTLTINGIIRLKGEYPLNYWKYPSSWEATGKYDEFKETKDTLPCKGGLATAKLDGKVQSKHIFKWDKTGESHEDTDVSIGDVQEGNQVPIDFRIPKIVLKTSGYSRDSYLTDCPKPNGDFDGPSVPWDVEIPLDSQRINFVGSYFPGSPEKISGSATLESGKTGTVIVTYNLYKLYKPTP